MPRSTPFAWTGPASGRLAAGLDGLQLATGLALALFIAVHLLSLAAVFLGTDAINRLDAFYEGAGLTRLGLPGIALLLAAHFVLAARKIPVRTGEQAVLLAHARRLAHAETWLWIVQAATGMIILILAAIHLWTVLTDQPITAATSAARIRDGWWLAFYLVLLPATLAHTVVGCARIGLKWGLVGRRGRKDLGNARNLALLFFLALGLLTLLRFAFLTPGGAS